MSYLSQLLFCVCLSVCVFVVSNFRTKWFEIIGAFLNNVKQKGGLLPSRTFCSVYRFTLAPRSTPPETKFHTVETRGRRTRAADRLYRTVQYCCLRVPHLSSLQQFAVKSLCTLDMTAYLTSVFNYLIFRID